MARKTQKPAPELRPFNSNAAEERRQREHKLLASAGYRKVKIEDLEAQALEREADKILENADRQMLEAIAANVQALCEGMAALKLPSNDPEYLKRLQHSDAQRSALSNLILQVDVVRDGHKTYLGVGSFPHSDALDIARRLSEHLEAKIRTWPAE